MSEEDHREPVVSLDAAHDWFDADCGHTVEPDEPVIVLIPIERESGVAKVCRRRQCCGLFFEAMHRLNGLPVEAVVHAREVAATADASHNPGMRSLAFHRAVEWAWTVLRYGSDT